VVQERFLARLKIMPGSGALASKFIRLLAFCVMCARVTSAFMLPPLLLSRSVGVAQHRRSLVKDNRGWMFGQALATVALSSNTDGPVGGGDAFTDGLLQRIAELSEKEQQEDSRVSKKPVYLAMFNANTSEEGVHTLESPPGSGRNTVMAFHGKEDCYRFCLTLAAQGFYDPEPREIPLNQVHL